MKTALDILTDPQSPARQKVLAAARLLHDHFVLTPEVFDEIYGVRCLDGTLKIASQVLWAWIEKTIPAEFKWEETDQIHLKKNINKICDNPCESVSKTIRDHPCPSVVKPDIDETHDRPRRGRKSRADYGFNHRSLAEFHSQISKDAAAVIAAADPDAPGFVPIRYWGKSGYKFVSVQGSWYVAQFIRPGFVFREGGFDDPVEAQKAALRAARKYLGITKNKPQRNTE